MCLRAFSLVLVIDIKTAKTITCFLISKALDTWLQSLFFDTVVIRNLIYILLFPAINLLLINFIDRVGGIPLVLMLLPLLILFGFIARLGILGRSGHRSFSLRYVPVIVFYYSLSLDLMCGGISQPLSSDDLLISLPYVET